MQIIARLPTATNSYNSLKKAHRPRSIETMPNFRPKDKRKPSLVIRISRRSKLRAAANSRHPRHCSFHHPCKLPSPPVLAFPARLSRCIFHASNSLLEKKVAPPYEGVQMRRAALFNELPCVRKLLCHGTGFSGPEVAFFMRFAVESGGF